MAIRDWFSAVLPGPLTVPQMPRESVVNDAQAMAGETQYFSSMNDPEFFEFIRTGGGNGTEAGITVTVKDALKNSTVFRCVSLISFSAGMLPLHIQDKATKENAPDLPLATLLQTKPNAWQTPFEFRALMQQRVLLYGNAYALKVRSGPKLLQLVPLHPDQVTVKQRDDWTLEYVFSGNGKASQRTFAAEDIFHLRYGISEDGLSGVSLVKQSAEAIALAIQSERAAARIFRQGLMAGGFISHPKELSPKARKNLEASMVRKSSAENAGKWLIVEEGMEAKPFAHSSRDSQHNETRELQIEEIARPYGVPRPLLGVDDTSWGSGIGVLGQYFVRYGLNPCFTAWEQAIIRDCMRPDEAARYEPKFDARVLLRGSMAEQAEFFAKGLGSGGHQPWMSADEVREDLDMKQGVDLPPPPGQSKGTSNEPA